MKKALRKMFMCLAAAVVAAASVALIGCAKTPDADPEPAKLKGLAADAAAIVAGLNSGDIDYALAAEPMVSAITGKAENGVERLYDVQSAWGGGYPQAVLLVKNEVAADGEFVEALLTALEGAAAWPDGHAAEAVTAINAHFDDDGESTLKAAALSSAAIAGSNISLQRAAVARDEVKNYLADIRKVDEAAAKEVGDGFFLSETTGGTPVEGEINIFMPDGAPALAFAKLMAENSNLGRNVAYHVVTADKIGSKVATKAGDVVLLPVNAASLLAADGSAYKLAGVCTHGNLFIIGKHVEGEFSLESLRGKVTGVVQIANVPGLTLKATLFKNNIAYTEA